MEARKYIRKLVRLNQLASRWGAFTGGVLKMDRRNQLIAEVQLHKTAMKAADIVRVGWFKPASVNRAVKCFKDTGGYEDRPRIRRPATSSLLGALRKSLCKCAKKCGALDAQKLLRKEMLGSASATFEALSRIR
ncbi:hypothetical protein KIN20_032513 [Parelaphostrongylus tenuis]|uniref:Uncharacterized protein n=1 Tax=Parelaphostrongylus tenuis TaxID=148309 RepID=A0AAD5R6Q7_PARTN|nr:hypothetical protein KIN20_032513 [Parelaphostrongylus tenuis]